jgi:hypothetical protein
LAQAEDYNLVSGESTYTVKHLVKRVQGTTKELKGKVKCVEEACEFLVAAPVKSFASSDANRDENMLMTLESTKFPLVTAAGKVGHKDFKGSEKYQVPVDVTFHGIKQNYQATVKRNSNGTQSAEMVILLTKHQIQRPSLFGVSIDDEVPLQFELKWSEAK